MWATRMRAKTCPLPFFKKSTIFSTKVKSFFGPRSMNKHKNSRLMSVITMGCRVNQFETELLRHGGFERGFAIAGIDEQAELVIINTCSVTNESDRQARQLIRRAARDNPTAKVVVTGCYAQNTPDMVKELPQVALVLGNREKNALWSFVDTLYAEDANGADDEKNDVDQVIHVGDIAALDRVPERPVVDTFAERSRAFLQLQDGCDRSCTYCLIPGVRGPSRSLTREQIIGQGARFIKSGFRELVLTGIDLGSFGRDLLPPVSLAEIIRELIAIPGCGRVRLSSIDPADLDEEFFLLFAAEKRICPYLHLSIQSGDDMILKRMGRKSDRRIIMDKITRIKNLRPETLLGADMIVGFPTEDDAAFANSLSLTKEARFAFLHIFRYSDRPGTPAAAIPARFRVSGTVVKQRSETLRLVGEENLAFLAAESLGKTVEVLIETLDNGVARGKSETFLPVSFKAAPTDGVGELQKVKLMEFDRLSGCLQGVAL